MGRIRTIKPEFWRHEDLSALPEATHLLAAALLNYADDEGYFNANVRLIAAELTPLREPSVSIHCSLNQLAGIGYLKLGTGADGKRYGRIVKFCEHQRVNRPTPSKIKQIGVVWDDDVSAHTQLSEDSVSAHPLKGTGNREQGITRSVRARDETPDLAQPTNGHGDGHEHPPDDPATADQDAKKRETARALRTQARALLAFLNERTGRRYPDSEANLALIVARLREGYSERELRQVVAKKAREWLPDERMAPYLRPATLFGRQKFAQYVGELGAVEASAWTPSVS